MKLNEIILGHPIRCYDKPDCYDRFTVVYMGEPGDKPNHFSFVGMSENPFHPMGFGQHGIAMPGKHLGKRIPFASLPEDCRRLVTLDLTQPESP